MHTKNQNFLAFIYTARHLSVNNFAYIQGRYKHKKAACIQVVIKINQQKNLVATINFFDRGLYCTILPFFKWNL